MDRHHDPRPSRSRGTGLLNNTVYAGILSWNHCSYVKNPRSEREEVPAPELRIIDDDLWQLTTARRGRAAW
jgi:hypothetical protein